MELKTESIKSTISYVKLFALLLFLYMTIGGYLSISFATNIHSISLLVISFIIFVIAPIIFNRPFRLLFLRQIKFTFNDDFVLIEIFNYKTGLLEKKSQLKYIGIQSCILSSSSKKTSTIKLFILGSKKLQYTFVNEEKIEEGASDFQVNVSIEVFKKIYSFNESIVLSPPFYASQNGIVALIILTALLIADIIINIIYHSSFLPVTLLMGSALYLQILIRRKRDIEIFNNI